MGAWMQAGLCRRVALTLAVVALGAQAGCKTDTASRVLTLRSALAPTSSCAFLASNPTLTEGYYDPWVNSGEGAAFGFAVENLSAKTGDEKVGEGLGGADVANIDVVRHDAQVTAVEGCFFAANALNSPSYGLRGDGSVIDCATLPAAQRQLRFAGITVDEGEGLSIVTMRALGLADLRALFGPTFDPTAIPVRGASVSTDASINPNVGGLGQSTATSLAYSYTPKEPNDPNARDPAWGAFYPTEAAATVLMQMRVVARMSSGGMAHSNWYVLPVTVCPGCLRDICGPLVQKVCARGPCSDGTPCLNDGTCAAGPPATCAPIQVLSGKVPNFAVDGACLPAQAIPGLIGPSCVAVGCDEGA